MKRHARIALLLTILLPLPYSLGQEAPSPPAPTPKQDEPKQDVPSGELPRAVSDVPDSVWDAPLPRFTDPQEVAVYYLAAVLADKQEHAAALTSSTNRRYGTQEFIAKLRADVEVASLRIETVAVMNNQAWVVSGPAKVKKEDPKLGDDPRVILALRANREPERQHWLIAHVYVVSSDNAKKEVETLNSQVDLSKAPYRIRVGDKLCFGSPPNPTRTFTVQPDGTITVKPLGRVWASGLTTYELQARLGEGLNSYYEATDMGPPITVMPAKVNTGGATVAGVPPVPATPATSSPRTAAWAFVAAAREGRVDDALGLIKGPGNTDQHTIALFRKFFAAKLPMFESVLVSQRSGEAAALFLAPPSLTPSPAGLPDADSPPDWTGRILLLLTRTDKGWFVTGNEIDSPDNEFVANELQHFQSTHPDATFDWMVEQKQKRQSNVGAAPPLHATSPNYANASTTTTSVKVPIPFRFRAGDEVRFECGADPKLDRTVTVLPDGTITLPNLGQVKATDLTIAELREQLEQAYQEYYTSPSVTVSATPSNSPEPRWPSGYAPSPSLVGAVVPPSRFARIPTGNANLPGEPEYRQRGNIIVSWSDSGDTVWGYSKTLGKWTKQEIQPPAKDGLSRVTGENIALVRAGRSFYGYSGQTGRWDKLTLPEDWKQGSCPVYEDTIVLTAEDNIYTFANTTGRWSSRDGSPEPTNPAEQDPLTAANVNLIAMQEIYNLHEKATARKVNEYLAEKQKQSPTERKQLEEQVQTLVQEAFQARQTLQRAELETFRRRLDAVEKQIGERERRKDEIIQRRVNELLNPNLKWDSVDVGEAGDAAEATSTDEQIPVLPATKAPFEIDAYFSSTPDSPTRTNVATAGEDVWLILEVRSPKKQRLTGLSISIDLDDAFKPQQVSRAYQREGNLFTWQNQSVKADATGRYVVNCLCVAPTENARCWVTVNGAAGQWEMRRAILRIATAETTQDVPAPPAKDPPSPNDA